ncbi:MAG TPA: diaminopimelate decarboxylase, partial [Gemmatimonadales bacterium]|nr:diaminopimelate decarboxylase [Gemmatimonadales bacterium]
RALTAGFDPAAIVFSGVGKTDQEIEAALKAGVGQINVESEEELDAVIEVARTLGIRAPVGIRVNPEVLVEVHPYTSTGERGKKFGVPFDEAGELGYRAWRTGELEFKGLGMHIGSGITSAGPFIEAVVKVLELVAELRGRGVDSMSTLDLGGGLGIRYHADDRPLDVRDYAEALLPHVATSRLFLLLEPGRFIVGEAGVLVTRVLYCKRSGGRAIAIVDAGMSDLIRPSHYDAYHEILVDRAHGRRRVVYDVVGPICESGDFLALDRELPEVRRGDLLAIQNAGAYGFTMASTYNARPRPAELLVDEGRWAVVRQRETLDDLVRGEELEPAWRGDGRD